MKQKSILYILVPILVIATSFIKRPTKDERPNIVFIEVDDLTAKYLGAFGAKFAKTPNIDALAASGVVFDNAVCQGTMCAPSRNSLITGQYPHNMGFYLNGQMRALPKNVWTFPKALKQEGYSTLWVGKCHIRPDQAGIKADNRVDKKNKAMQAEMGFDYVYQSEGRVVILKNLKKKVEANEQGDENAEPIKGDKAAKKEARKAARKAERKEAKANGGTIKTNNEITDWVNGEDAYGDYLQSVGKLNTFLKEGGKVPTSLDENTEYLDGHFATKALDALKNYKEEKPFFMWVNFSCPHGPFDVPQKYHDKFKGTTFPAPIDPATEQFNVPADIKPHKSKLTKATIPAEQAAYSASIAYMDAQVGRIVNFIKSSRFADNTIIVFFSDQGILVGDHGLEHKGTLFKEVLNPALIVNYKNFKARRVAEPVELLDLAKTTLAIAGATEQNAKACPNGYSLLPLLNGQGKYNRNGVAFGEIENFIAAFDGRYKYIDNKEQPILFDLQKDPNETINYASSNPTKVAELQKAVKDWIAQTGAIKPPQKQVVKKDDEAD
jgi:arylsulfatase A-like enzyme